MRAALVDIQRNIDKANRSDGRVQNLASYINVESLRKAYKSMDGRKAVGIDKVTKDEYGKDLSMKLSDLGARMKRGPITRTHQEGYISQKMEKVKCGHWGYHHLKISWLRQ